jgi:hypothetical protein
MSAFDVYEPPRGEGAQEEATYPAQRISISASWGVAPASASITYVGGSAITRGALVRITAGAYTFYGICQSDTEVDASNGNLRTLEFRDLRDFLTWDNVYCAFNRPDVRMVNGERVKRYKHLLPVNFTKWQWTYSDDPLAGYQIISYILGAFTVGSPWIWDLTGSGLWPSGLMNDPIYNLDFTNGRRLDAALAEICARTGLVLTLDSSNDLFPYCLVFQRKGYGASPLPFPTNSDNRRTGEALSGNATHIVVLGGRNRYQVTEIPMVADWSSGWEQFMVFDELVWDIYSNEENASGVAYNAYSSDPDHWLGYSDAKVRALTITVADYVALRTARDGGGAAFVDTRKYAGRWRMDMPAALYIKTILRRAFRPNLTGIVNWEGETVPVASLDISDQMIAKVTVNYATGAMTNEVSEPVDGNGVLLAKGYQVGEDLFRLAPSDRLPSNFFSAAARSWGHVPFQIDDSGEGSRFLITESPVFVSSNMLVTVDGVTRLNAGFTLSTPSMTAALVFEAERYVFGKSNIAAELTGREHCEPVPELNREAVGKYGVWSYAESLYANSEAADDKAEAIADNLLLLQYAISTGGYNLKWKPTTALSSFGPQLGSKIDRVQLEISPGGIEAVVDLTNERGRDNFEPERELDRRSAQAAYFPGQQELKQEADDTKRLRAGIKQTQDAGLWNLFQRYLRGELTGAETEVWIPGGTGTLASGTAIVSAGATPGGSNSIRTAKMPASTTTADAFLGVVVVNGVSAAKPFIVQSSGVAYALVQGPVSVNDMVGLVAGQAYLNAASTVSVGKALQSIGDSSTKLIPVMLGAGGGGVGGAGTTKFKVTSTTSTYIVASRYDSSDAIVETGVHVAYPYGLETAPSGSYAIHPAYAVNDFIEASQAIDGTWRDINMAARKWCIELHVCIAGVETTLQFAAQP